MSQRKQKQINSLINALIEKGLNNKNIWINKSTSSYGAMSKETIEKLQLNDSNLKLIIFVSLQKNSNVFQFWNKQETIMMTNSYKKACSRMDQQKQNGNNNTFLYVSSIANYQYTNLDEFRFLEYVAKLLREFTGRVILQINPMYQKNFNKQFKNFISYFSRLNTKVQFLQGTFYDSYLLFDSLTGKTIEWDVLDFNQEKHQNQNGKKMLSQKTTNELRKQRTIIATKNVWQTYTHLQKKQTFKFDSSQNYENDKTIQRIRDHFIYDQNQINPELETILEIYKQYGIICCQLKNISILKAALEKESIQIDENDSYFTQNYENFQCSLACYIVQNPASFPIVITDNPLYFLMGRTFTFGNLQIQDSFYETQLSVDTLKKIILRNNNQNNNEIKSISTFTNKDKFKKKLKQLNSQQTIYEYPINLERRFKAYLQKDQKDQIQIKETKYYGKFVQKALDILLLQEKQQVHLIGTDFFMNRALWVSQTIKRKVSGLHQIIELTQKQRSLSPTKNRPRKIKSENYLNQNKEQQIKIILTKKPTSQQQSSIGYMSPMRFQELAQFETKQSWDKRKNEKKLRDKGVYGRGQQKTRGKRLENN